MLSHNSLVASVVLGAVSAEAFLAPAMPNRLPAMAALRGNLAPQAGMNNVRMTISPTNTEEENPELWKGTQTLDNQLRVRIDNEWYDLSRWRKAHPAGTHWIDLYKDRDATEVMYGFHSDKAMDMMKRLPKAKTAPDDVPPPSQTTMNFRKWRADLVQKGWFERDWKHEAFNLGSWAVWLTAGIMLAQFHTLGMQFLAATVLGISNTIAGWLSHDYVHGRGKFCDFMRPFGHICGGMSPTWWSDKHNVHHARTNEVGIDEDIATDPALFLWAPDPKNDAPWRKYQGAYLPLPMSMLFLIWRFDSIRVAIERKDVKEMVGLAAHYAFMLTFVSPLTFLGAMLISGFMTATITTVTHQSEEIFFDENPEFVDGQFRSTRDAVCSNPFSEWLWGGMQYQLEHHLFPTMPRYKYPALMPEVKKFAEENKLDLRITNEWELLKLNVDNYKRVALLEPAPGAKGSRPESKKNDITSIIASVAN